MQAGGREKVLTGNDPEATNNRMELTAALRALQALTRPSDVDLYTDSEYLRRGVTEWLAGWEANGWRAKRGNRPIRNVDLWRPLAEQVRRHTIEWHWVKGHAGDAMNERVDQLAREARLAITPRQLVDDNAPRLTLGVSYRHKARVGGWAVVKDDGDERQTLAGVETGTSSNRLELRAAINALTLLPYGSAAFLFTSNDYLFQGATQWIHGWRKREWVKRDGKPVANADLWQLLDAALQTYQIHWINAKGQGDAEALEAARELARAQANEA